MGAREELSPGTVAKCVWALWEPTYLPNVGSSGWQVGTACAGGHQQQQRHLPVGSGAPGHTRSLPRTGLGALADILAVK